MRAAVAHLLRRRFGDRRRGGGVGPDDRGTAGGGNGVEERAAAGIDLEGSDDFVPRLHDAPAFHRPPGPASRLLLARRTPRGSGTPSLEWAICACGSRFSVTRLTRKSNSGCRTAWIGPPMTAAPRA